MRWDYIIIVLSKDNKFNLRYIISLDILNSERKSNKKISHKKDDKNWMPLISKSHQSSELEGLKLVEMKFPNQMIIGISLSMDDIQLLLKGLYHATTVIR